MADDRRYWLRKDDAEASSASFPELFFDLVFVFALIQLSETLVEDFTFGIASEAVLFILALWWVWIHTTWVTNLLDSEIVPVRIFLFVLMFLGIVLAIALPKAFTDMGLVFALAYCAMQLSRSLLALYAFRNGDRAAFTTFLRITAWLVVSGALWVAGGLSEPHLRVLFWVAALAVEYIGPVARYWLPSIGAAPPEALKVDGEHLAERCALFVIIALGETILTTGKNASAHLENAATMPVLVLAFLTTVLMWWLYFHHGQEKAAEKAEQTSRPQETAQHLFTYGHLPIIAGIILTAVGEDFSLTHPFESGSASSALALLGGPALYLAGLGWMRAASSRIVPYAHIAGISLLGVTYLLVSNTTNFLIHLTTVAILFGVAVGEAAAVKWYGSRAA
ncbi:low temperature requirement protein A [Rhizobium sp. TRM96647]|uniref:low temperature requirement protein A n=1 Tax=unclassified Rhizobium TaxID=2613769 RepID=UPI0021E8315C|nr:MULTISPECIES: low temperature requirement protein A [unclassified Rhizobium]MCV3739132.1 low temperature requirement protein A [Rhizobium sp. TRM96647]MCV3760725.1 low temperature requirement protein A [Rhizobium sp. TRM96650]